LTKPKPEKVTPKRNKSKYGNKKVMQDDIVFDSHLERDYYLHLKALAKAGAIKGFTLQPRFELIPRFKNAGKSFRKTEYVADFEVYMNDGTTEILDTKGKETDVFKIKRKLLELQNPLINFFIVKKEYGQWTKKR
jgi:hypothetical protein